MLGGMIAALCLDFDDTLAHRPADFGALLDQIRAELALLHCDFDGFADLLRAELARDGAVTLASALGATLGCLGQRRDDDLASVVERALASYAAPMRLLPGAGELLDWLRGRGVPLALITNGPDDLQRAAIAAVGIAGA